jgi:hypothetical protein
MVERERYINGEISRETSYYVTSPTGDAERVARAVRGHWGSGKTSHESEEMLLLRALLSYAYGAESPTRRKFIQTGN